MGRPRHFAVAVLSSMFQELPQRVWSVRRGKADLGDGGRLTLGTRAGFCISEGLGEEGHPEPIQNFEKFQNNLQNFEKFQNICQNFEKYFENF